MNIFENSAQKYKSAYKYQVWQTRFDDLLINDEDTFFTKLEYIHNNPLQEHWQLVNAPEEYEYSSAHFYITGKQGKIPVQFAEVTRGPVCA